MEAIQIQVKRELFRFDNQAQWVSKAQSWPAWALKQGWLGEVKYFSVIA